MASAIGPGNGSRKWLWETWGASLPARASANSLDRGAARVWLPVFPVGRNPCLYPRRGHSLPPRPCGRPGWDRPCGTHLRPVPIAGCEHQGETWLPFFLWVGARARCRGARRWEAFLALQGRGGVRYRFLGAVPFLVRGRCASTATGPRGRCPSFVWGLVRSCHRIRASPSPTTPSWLLWSMMPAGSPSPPGGYSSPQPCGWLRCRPGLCRKPLVLPHASFAGLARPTTLVHGAGCASFAVWLLWSLAHRGFRWLEQYHHAGTHLAYQPRSGTHHGAQPGWLFSVKAGLQPPDISRPGTVKSTAASPAWDSASRDCCCLMELVRFLWALGASRERTLRGWRTGSDCTMLLLRAFRLDVGLAPPK